MLIILTRTEQTLLLSGTRAKANYCAGRVLRARAYTLLYYTRIRSDRDFLFRFKYGLKPEFPPTPSVHCSNIVHIIIIFVIDDTADPRSVMNVIIV